MSEKENPYKGVRGGDPRLRAAHVPKPVVATDFICAKCGEKKTEKFREGKDLTGRVCVECKNREGLVKQAEARKRQDEWYDQLRRERLEALKPTAEAIAAALVKYADSPHQTCSHCGGSFPISQPTLYDTGEIFWGRYSVIPTVAYVADPFDSEIRGEENVSWLCYPCYEGIAGDI